MDILFKYTLTENEIIDICTEFGLSILTIIYSVIMPLRIPSHTTNSPTEFLNHRYPLTNSRTPKKASNPYVVNRLSQGTITLLSRLLGGGACRRGVRSQCLRQPT